MILQIGEDSIEISSFEIGAALFDKSYERESGNECGVVGYGLGIFCEEQDFDGEEWEPEMDFDNLELPINSWEEMEGVTLRDVRGNASITDHHGEALATTILFKKRVGTGFEVEIKGICDICTGSYGMDVPFTVKGICEFSGYRVCGRSGDTDESLTAMLEKHVSIKYLEGQEIEREQYGTNPEMVTKQFEAVDPDVD